MIGLVIFGLLIVTFTALVLAYISISFIIKHFTMVIEEYLDTGDTRMTSEELRKEYDAGNITAEQFIEKLFESEEADRVRRNVVEKVEVVN